jgi:hypothetical protein
MNTHLWYLSGAKSANLSMPYLNWKDFRCVITTNDNLPILIDFGDGNAQSVLGNGSETIYSRATASDGVVTIYNANRLRRIAFEGIAIYRVNWLFSLSVFRVANNLISLDFRSGNLFGDVGNLAPTLETFQILNPESGIKTNLEPCPPATLVFNQTGVNCEYEFDNNQIATEMPLLQSLTISGKSRVYDDLQNLPSTLRTIEISNTDFNIAINRRNRIGYNLSTLTFATNFTRFVIDAENGFGFNTAQLDAVLNNLATLTWHPTNEKLIRLTNGHGVRSSASNTAVATLTALTNMTILLN